MKHSEEIKHSTEKKVVLVNNRIVEIGEVGGYGIHDCIYFIFEIFGKFSITIP